MTDKEKRAKIFEAFCKRLTDEGRIIEAGFASFLAVAIHADASEAQIRDMRMAFMAGAQHLFTSIMIVMDPGMEPSDDDLRRMDMIHAELDKFSDEIKLRAQPKG